MDKIPADFYRQEDVVALSRQLLGKVLCTRVDEKITRGIIMETEAYDGIGDKACHAYGNRRTPRTEVMFEAGGVAYVYLCYGIHHLFNIVTGEKDNPQAVLVRGIAPLEGLETMLTRRNNPPLKRLAAGPGTVSQALGIHTRQSGISLQSEVIWLEDHRIEVPEREVKIGPRIGVDYAEEDAFLPYRFVWGFGR
jgi:DNA-3-methyladenine glycosylase